MTKIRQLRALVGLRGMTQQELAQHLGIGRDRLLRIEHGYARPTPEEARQLAAALKCKVSDLGLATRRQAEAGR